MLVPTALTRPRAFLSSGYVPDIVILDQRRVRRGVEDRSSCRHGPEILGKMLCMATAKVSWRRRQGEADAVTGTHAAEGSQTRVDLSTTGLQLRAEFRQ